MALKKGSYTSPSGEKQTGVDVVSAFHGGGIGGAVAAAGTAAKGGAGNVERGIN
jgi:hypothetical protein